MRTGEVSDHKTVRVRDFLCVEEGLPQYTSPEFLSYLSYIQRYASDQPKTYWFRIPFYTIVQTARRKFLFGHRPQDLEYIKVIEQKSWGKHLTHLSRLERFPLDKAEYYLKLKETHGINGLRGLSKITGEDWSYIARVLRTLDLPELVKDYLKSNKSNPGVLKFFHLRRIMEIVQQSEERLQLTRFRELIEEFEASSYEAIRNNR